ncbi:ABC transporter permease [Alteribacter populi]|uniref:ABC transporter permease n=1 Tax=Alteribacter populi TaxID=2011011 RepID=UPI001E5FB9EC|nr:ABC transporter permease subunit [Alteribacter populi]
MEMKTNSKIDEYQTTLNKKSSLLNRFAKSKYLLLLFVPCFLYFIVFKYLPMFGMVISFKDYNLFQGIWASEWVGLDHYIMFFTGPDFYRLLKNTLLLSFYNLLFGFPAPIILALLFNEIRVKLFKRFVQSVSYLPHFLSNVVVISMAVMFLSPNGGLVNQLIGYFGIDSINFIVHAEWFRTIYVTSDIWQTVGWSTIIYLAALAGINPQTYEAAEIDGANRWQQTLHVTIPGILPAMVILFLLNIGNLIELGFEKVYLLQTPLTYETSDVLATHVYRMGLVNGNYSYAAAVDFFTSVVSLILVVAFNYLARRTGQNTLW